MIQSAHTLNDWAHSLREGVDLSREAQSKARTQLESNLHKLAWAATTDDAEDSAQAVLEGVRSVRVFEGQPIPEITALMEGSRAWPEATRNAAAYELARVSSALKETSSRVLMKALELAQEQVESLPTEPRARFNLWRPLAVVGWLLLAGTFVRIPIHPGRAHREAVQRNACIPNLIMLDSAKATWQIEKRQPDTAVPDWADIVGPKGYMRDMPVCPKGGQYSLNALTTKARCGLHGTGPSLATPGGRN